MRAITIATTIGAKAFQLIWKLSLLTLATGVTATVSTLLMGVSFSSRPSKPSTRLFQSHRDHFPPKKRNLRRQRQILWANIVTGNQRHAAKDAVVIADQLVIIVVVAPVARVETEAGDLVEAHRADEI